MKRPAFQRNGPCFLPPESRMWIKPVKEQKTKTKGANKMRSITKIELQYAHRFYRFQGEAQYLHGHTGVLTIEVEDSSSAGTVDFIISDSTRLPITTDRKISIIPIMLNLNTTRISIINDNILFLIITTVLLILLYFVFYILLNKKPLITYITIILIIILSIIYPTNTLTIEKDNNEDIFIVDFIGLKSGTYEIDIKLDSDNYNGNIYLYKQFMQNHNLSYILIKQESLKDNIKIKFKVEKDAEYYSLKISNNLMNFKIKSIELTKGKNKKEIPVNYYLLPYNYIKQLEQLKYDGTSIGSRLEIYKLCLEIIKDNPLLGHGFDYFKIANKNTNINYILVEHSQIMTLGVQNGIISIIIWIVLLITIIIEIIKKRSIKNLELNIIIILLIYTSLFDFTMSYHFFLLLFFIFCNYLFTKKAL